MIAGHRNFIEDLWDQVHLRDFGNLAISSPSSSSFTLLCLTYYSFTLISCEKQYPWTHESLQFVCGRSSAIQEISSTYVWKVGSTLSWPSTSFNRFIEKPSCAAAAELEDLDRVITAMKMGSGFGIASALYITHAALVYMSRTLRRFLARFINPISGYSELKKLLKRIIRENEMALLKLWFTYW